MRSRSSSSRMFLISADVRRLSTSEAGGEPAPSLLLSLSLALVITTSENRSLSRLQAEASAANPFRNPKCFRLKAGLRTALYALAMVAPLVQYNVARVGAGIPRPISSTTNPGGEYPPLRAIRWPNSRPRFELRVDHVVGTALLCPLPSGALRPTRRGARVSGGRQARGQLL